MPNQDQISHWNGPAGQAWVDAQPLIEGTFQPFEDLLTKDIPGGRVLDVGCGTGSVTAAAAGRDARCTGVDVSEQMIEVARRRGIPNAEFLCADVQVYPFAPESFDVILSRFGVMFFENPVQAFSNLRRAAKPDGRLRFAAWRSPEENPFMTTAERAAELPPRDPGAPGQFAFADRKRVERILAESGWEGVQIEPIDVPCRFPASGLDTYITRLGPFGMADEDTKQRLMGKVREAFQPFVLGDEVRFTAACYLVNASRVGWRTA